MTNLLVKLFIKDKENTNNVNVRTAYGVLSSVVGIICNILLFAVKFATGLFINSISVIGDAFNNLSDAGSSIISFIGVKLAQKPADKEHPFGHGRFEYISALAVAFLILQVGFSLFKSSIEKIISPEEVGFNWPVIVILIISVLVKLWLSYFNRVLGRKINSNVLMATSADSLNDVFVTSATIISLIVYRFTDLNIDGFMGIVVSAFVLLAGYNIAKDTLEPLLGEPIDREIYENITQMVESYDGIVGSHDLIAHNYGPSYIMATIHAEVSNDCDIEKIHETIDQIERDVVRELGIFLVIHMDPIEVKNEVIKEKKKMVEEVIKNVDPKTSFHDFRVVNGEQSINLIFDLVVPHSYDNKKVDSIVQAISEKINEVSPKYHCVITIDKNFIAEEG